MNDRLFDKHRQSFRHLMIEKPLNELEAMLRVFERLNTMTQGQRESLVEDMRLMVSYKTRIDFEAMIKPAFQDWVRNEKAS